MNSISPSVDLLNTTIDQLVKINWSQSRLVRPLPQYYRIKSVMNYLHEIVVRTSSVQSYLV